MPSWKKVIVSGSNAHLTGITSSVLTVNNILQAGTGGAIQNSGITLSGNTLALGGNSITSTGANSVLTGSFSGTFSGSLSVNLQDLTAGDGIENFTYDGNSAAIVQAAVTASSGDFLYWATPIGKSRFSGSGGLGYDSLNDRISISKNLAITTPLAVGALSSTMLVLTSSNRVATQTLGTGIATFLSTPSSANLATAVTDETGTGTLVFSASPTFTGTVVAANISASGNISGSTLHITGNETIGGTSTIAGRLTANGDVTTTNITASGNISSSAGLIGATLTTSGNGTIGGNLTTTQITASGNISSSAGLIGATLTTSGNGTIGGNLTVNGNTILGDANADTVTINAATVTAANLPTYTAGTHNSVLIQSASNIIAKRDIDSRVWGSTLISGSGTANQIAYFNASTGIVGDTGLTYNASTDVLTVNGSTFGQDVTIAGNLTVNGDTIIIDTTNLSVEDKFIILAHGSGSISPIQEGGIIIEGSTADSGQAFVFNSGSSAGVTGRWGVAANVHATSSDVTPTDYMVSANTAAGAPSSAPTYGGTNGGYGNIYVNSSDESIWIFS